MSNFTAARVKEISATTGTGNYTLAGASANFRTFAAAFAEGAECYVPYVATMGSDFEYGIGRLSDATTLVRVKVIESSNADAAVDWAAGTKTIFCAHGGLGQVAGRNKLNDANAPVTTDNYAQGFAFGSLWGSPSSNGIVFACVDPGNSGAPTATWRPIASDVFDFPRYDSGAIDTYNNNGAVAAYDARMHDDLSAYGSLLSGSQPRAYWPMARIRGIDDPANSYATHGTAIRAQVAVVGSTANATPANLYIANDSSGGFLVVPPAATCHFTARVIAREPATGDSKVWTLELVAQRIGTGNPALIGTVTKTVIQASAGAAAWDIATAFNNDFFSGDPAGYKGIEVQVTGEAAHTIRWIADIDILIGGDGE